MFSSSSPDCLFVVQSCIPVSHPCLVVLQPCLPSTYHINPCVQPTLQCWLSIYTRDTLRLTVQSPQGCSPTSYRGVYPPEDRQSTTRQSVNTTRGLSHEHIPCLLPSAIHHSCDPFGSSFLYIFLFSLTTYLSRLFPACSMSARST